MDENDAENPRATRQTCPLLGAGPGDMLETVDDPQVEGEPFGASGTELAVFTAGAAPILPHAVASGARGGRVRHRPQLAAIVATDGTQHAIAVVVAPGEVDFPGARMLLLVRQQRWKDDGRVKEEYRYFVTSLDTTVFNFHQLLRLVRVHWGIENRHNWTLDVVLGEDARQPCRPTRTALEVVAWLRAMAFNLISCCRARLPPEGRHLVEWARACEPLRDTLVHGRRQQALPTPA